jgi:hypothetical protein
MITKQQRERLLECVKLLANNRYPAEQGAYRHGCDDSGEVTFCAIGVLADVCVKADADLRWGGDYWEADGLFRRRVVRRAGYRDQIYQTPIEVGAAIEDHFGLTPNQQGSVVNVNDAAESAEEGHRKAAKCILELLDREKHN